MASPIADLTYRNYDGPLEPPINRWWAIAKASMRISWTRKGAWVWKFLAVISAIYYFIMVCVFYAIETFSPKSPVGGVDPVQIFFSRIDWKNQFLNGFSFAQLGLMLVVLSIGVGTIANDNKANALLVYLSKPCSKLDYLIGKWMGIFLPLLIITAAPTLLFFGYCGLSYKQYHFFDQDPLIFLRVLTLIPLAAVLHASLALGISSLFNNSRMAGASYAGLYFMTLFMTTFMGGIHAVSFMNGGHGPAKAVDFLFYCSVDGLQIGLAKVFLGINGAPLGGSPQGLDPQAQIVPMPNGWLIGGIYLALCLLSLWIAWIKVRAVEVIGS